MKFPLIVFALGLTLASGAVRAGDGDIDKVLGSVEVAAGEHAGDVSTVNGAVRLADGASVREASTVNGSVHAGDRVSADTLETVNGSIDVGADGRVSGHIETVNGSITLDHGTQVHGHVSNVNGRIELRAAQVGEGLETVSGDIEVGADSRVDGGILVDKPHGSWFHFGTRRTPRIVIGPGAVVHGTLEFRREVELYVSDRAQVGTIKGATAQRFSGDRP